MDEFNFVVKYFQEIDSPVTRHIDIHSGSETSEEEVGSDLEVADIDRKIEKVELRLLQTQEIAQQYEVLNDALEQSSTVSHFEILLLYI